MRYVVLTLLTLLPGVALAAGTSFFGPIVPPCTEYGGAVPICQACNAIQLVDNILRFFVSLAVMIAALMFAYAGFLYVSASSNKQNIDSAKKIFVNVFIGLIFVVAAYLIVDMTLKVLTGTPLSVLSQIQCVKMETTTGSIKYTVVPGQNPVTGTQGGGQQPSLAGGCTDGGITHDSAKSQLDAARVRVSASGRNEVSGTCSGWGCTNLSGMCQSTVDKIVTMQDALLKSGCAINVQGGTETGVHAKGGSHEKGYAIDTANTECLGKWLKANGSKYGVSSVCMTKADADKYGFGPCTGAGGKPYYEPADQPHFHINFGGGG